MNIAVRMDIEGSKLKITFLFSEGECKVTLIAFGDEVIELSLQMFFEMFRENGLELYETAATAEQDRRLSSLN